MGNLNAQYDIIPVTHIAQRKSGLVKQFMRSNSLVPINKAEICTGQNYTFAPFKSTIEYVRVPESFCDCILLCKVFSTDHTDITSYHLPIDCKLNVPIGRYKADSTDRPALLGWNKATTDNFINYQLLVVVEAKSLRDQFNCIDSGSDIENLNTAITDALLLTASYEKIQTKSMLFDF